MNRMNKSKFNFLAIILICLAAACGMFVPGFFLKQSSESFSGQLKKAPATINKGYGSASTELASSQLTEYEKIKIIANHANRFEPVKNSNTNIASNYEMAELAKDRLEAMYLNKLYPSSFKDEGSNRYTYDATCYKATDSNFHIFSSYYWIVSLTKFDKSETHTVLITENGTILYAQASIIGNVKEPEDVADHYSYLDIINGKVSSYAEITDSSDLKIPTYIGINPTFSDPNAGILTVGCPWMSTYQTVTDNWELHPEYEYYSIISDCQKSKSMLLYTIEIAPYQ